MHFYHDIPFISASAIYGVGGISFVASPHGGDTELSAPQASHDTLLHYSSPLQSLLQGQEVKPQEAIPVGHMSS